MKRAWTLVVAAAETLPISEVHAQISGVSASTTPRQRGDQRQHRQP
jgi:hypothetical protein